MGFFSVRLKPGFGIGNRNQDQVSVSVSGPELFMPKPKISSIFPSLIFFLQKCFAEMFGLKITLVQSNQFVSCQLPDFFVKNAKLFTLLIFMP